MMRHTHTSFGAMSGAGADQPMRHTAFGAMSGAGADLHPMRHTSFGAMAADEPPSEAECEQKSGAADDMAKIKKCLGQVSDADQDVVTAGKTIGQRWDQHLPKDHKLYRMGDTSLPIEIIIQPPRWDCFLSSSLALRAGAPPTGMNYKAVTPRKLG